jgi:GH35 family endo-1,4-beta-xylanase
VHISELDISCGAWNADYKKSYVCAQWTDAEKTAQATLYKQIAQVCVDEKATCTNFEVWGLSDKDSWLN